MYLCKCLKTDGAWRPYLDTKKDLYFHLGINAIISYSNYRPVGCIGLSVIFFTALTRRIGYFGDLPPSPPPAVDRLVVLGHG